MNKFKKDKKEAAIFFWWICKSDPDAMWKKRDDQEFVLLKIKALNIIPFYEKKKQNLYLLVELCSANQLANDISHKI